MAKILIVGLTPAQQAQRKHKLALIHKAKRDLGFDDSFYRDLLEQITGRRSAAELTLRELDTVINHLRSKGWKTGDKSPSSSHLPPQWKKPHHLATALWIELGKAGKIQDGSDYALQEFAVKFLGPKQVRAVVLPGTRPIEALSDQQCAKLIAALKKIRDWEPADPKAQNGEEKK